MTRLQKALEDLTEEKKAEALRDIAQFYNDHLERLIELHKKHQVLTTEEQYKALLKLKEMLKDTMDEVYYERTVWYQHFGKGGC